MIKAINKKTGVESDFSKEQWEKMQNDSYWNGKFIEKKDSTPKEVKEMEAKKKATTEPAPPPEVKQRTTSNAEQSINIKK